MGGKIIGPDAIGAIGAGGAGVGVGVGVGGGLGGSQVLQVGGLVFKLPVTEQSDLQDIENLLQINYTDCLESLTRRISRAARGITRWWPRRWRTR